jgi:cobalamin biosynthesis protein CobT
MAKQHAIEKALIKATGQAPQKEGEKREKYLARLAKAGAKLEEKDWKGLTADVQGWVNAAGAAFNDEEPLPEFDAVPAPKGKAKKGAVDDDEEEQDEEEQGDDEEEEEEEEGDDEEEQEEGDEDEEEQEEEEKPAKKTAKKGGAKKEPKEKKPRDGAVHKILTVCCKNPGWPMDKVKAELEKKGVETSEATIATQFRNARNVIAVLKELGKLAD